MTRVNFARLRCEGRDLLELVLIPGLALAMPWPLAFAMFRRIARWSWLYREPSQRALEEATLRGWVSDAPEWLVRRKLTTLVDHADHYLTRTRSDRWMARYLQVEGAWPAAGRACLALTFHWGTGMWGVRHAGQAGLNGHMLVAAADSAQFKGRGVLRRYIRARVNSITLALRRPFIDVSVDMRAALKALRQQEQLFAVIDVPADQVTTSAPVEILGVPARLPTALLRLAVERRLPVCLFVTGMEMKTGLRFLRIRQLGVPGDVAGLTEQVAQELDGLIREMPPAWHFWGEAPRFFRG